MSPIYKKKKVGLLHRREEVDVRTKGFYSPWSSQPRSSRGPCIQWSLSLSPAQWRTGSATCCAPLWCAPQKSPSCCQTCPAPGLQKGKDTHFLWLKKNKTAGFCSTSFCEKVGRWRENSKSVKHMHSGSLTDLKVSFARETWEQDCKPVLSL